MIINFLNLFLYVTEVLIYLHTTENENSSSILLTFKNFLHLIILINSVV